MVSRKRFKLSTNEHSSSTHCQVIEKFQLGKKVFTLFKMEFQFDKYCFFYSLMSKFTGEVIKHGDAKCVQNEGMPMYRNPCEKGQLYINFQVRD